MNKIEKKHCVICDTNELMEDGGESLCLSCGYTTNPKFNLENTLDIENFEKASPRIISDLKITDKKNNCNWYPTIINFYKIGSVFPNGTKDDWKWAFAAYKPIPLFGRLKYKIEGSNDLYHEYALDFNKLVEYEKYDFKSAIKNLGDIYE